MNAYEYWLACLKGISNWGKIILREYMGSEEAIYNIEETRLNQVPFLKEKEREAVLNAKRVLVEPVPEDLKLVTFFQREYPKDLRHIADPPYGLFYRGNLPDEDAFTVAIVGSRRQTKYGEEMTYEFGKCLAKQGIQVISGLARGVDATAHRASLDAGGKTFGFLGCGVDICYPRENVGLYVDMQKTGGVLSELSPGTKPFASHFPARNRLISAISDVILVMEAREKSGSLITADMALEQGRDVFALPGLITNPLSEGCHRLIHQGAGILVSPEQFLEDLEEFHRFRKTNAYTGKIQNKKMLESEDNLLYSSLDLSPKGIQQLVNETGMAPEVILRELIRLEIEGKVHEVSRNHYIKV